MRSPVTVTKSGPGLAQLVKDLNRITHSEVLVGIPAEKTMRKKDPINNASLMFVLSKGSPARKIPPTPILEPAIERNRELIAPHLAASAKAVTEGRPDEAERELERAGFVASNAAKKFFTDPANGWPPNAPSTIARKGFDRRNINTSQLRRSIVHVVRHT